MAEGVGPNRPERKSKKIRPPSFHLTRVSMAAQRAVGRTTSWMWDEENDPFQVFEVQHESCFDLKIEVKNGLNITKGFYKDFIDIPDPYVILKIPGSSNSSKRTSHVDNNVNPIWDETFHFFLDPKKQHKLQVTLMDANTWQDGTLGVAELEVENLIQNYPTPFSFEFPGGSKVNTILTLQLNPNPDLRFSLSLCEEEKNFLRKRRLKALVKMQELLKERGPSDKREVPVIAVLGSGGGFRAMNCMSAAVKALHESGILKCCTYLSGLSGSSWFISTLYAHDNFPKVTYEEIYEEMKTSVTQNWKWHLLHSYQYIINIMKKSRGGQPVSFTDIFGHLLGDVILKGKKDKKLSDQRAIVKDGDVPLPLYTCLHAKASVSCRSYSEWIEFSPYEIGIAKYGTFMKTEYFGSKFLIGKLIKQFPEFPLHYLQGVWGSAFTILMKRLAFDGGPKQDIVQMMREANEERAINEKLEEEYLEHETNKYDSAHGDFTDSDDESDIKGADDKSSDDSDDVNQSTTNSLLASNTASSVEEKKMADISELPSLKEDERDNNQTKKLSKHQSEDNALNDDGSEKAKKPMRKFFSFDSTSKFKFGGHSDKCQEDPSRKISTQSDPGCCLYPTQTNAENRRNRLKRKNALKGDNSRASSYWLQKRKDRKSQKQQKPSIFQNLLKSSDFLNSRAGRAGEILNPFRGLSLRNSFPISPFAVNEGEESEDEEDTIKNGTIGPKCRYEPLDNTAKRLFIVDSGLAFNSPYPLLLRPQRAVDMYLSFDFSQRPSDEHMPFKELLLAEKWARQNQVLFPPIEKLVQKYSQDKEVKELYIFKDEDDPFCPVILHFTIVNNRFKWYKAPGVPRETKEEVEFANFSLFNDPKQPFASTNFVYEPLQYERLFKLTEFNTLLHIDTIKEEIASLVETKRKILARYAENTFARMANVMNACRKFQATGNLSLRVNEAQKKQFILACKMSNKLSKSISSSLEDGSPFFDTLDHWEEESDSEYDVAEEGPSSPLNTTECQDPKASEQKTCERTLSDNASLQFKLEFRKESVPSPEVLNDTEIDKTSQAFSQIEVTTEENKDCERTPLTNDNLMLELEKESDSSTNIMKNIEKNKSIKFVENITAVI